MVDSSGQPMVSSHAVVETPPEPATPSRSVSFAFSGRTILSAWVISILLHSAVFSVMLLLVLPYSPHADATISVSRAEPVGDVVAEERPEWGRELREVHSWGHSDLGTTDPLEFRVDLPQGGAPGDPSTALATGLPKGGELSIIGIGTGGGDLSRFGMGTGGGPGAEFFGLGRSAPGVQRIVYVVDRSGSMTDTFDFVRAEMKRSIGALRRSQRFHLIFFNFGEPVENPPRELVSAIAAQKLKAGEFLDGIMTGGGTDPEPAMRRAFAVGPDLIYFLTDGEFRDTLIQRLREWNKDRRVRIFTIAFMGAGGAGLLEQIAREHGGEFRHITEQDLP